MTTQKKGMTLLESLLVELARSVNFLGRQRGGLYYLCCPKEARGKIRETLIRIGCIKRVLVGTGLRQEEKEYIEMRLLNNLINREKMETLRMAEKILVDADIC